MEEKLKNKKIIVVSSTLLIMTIVVLLVITLKDSYAYYETSNELEIVNATIGKLKPTIEKVFIEEENKQYTNNPNPSVIIQWTDDNITEYCVTTEGTCSAFTTIQEPNTNSKSVTATNQITLSGDGLKTVNAYIKNKYGYTSAVSSGSITLDTTAPTVTSASATETKETSVTITIVANDNTSGIKEYCLTTTSKQCNETGVFQISSLTAGTQYTWPYTVTDNAGNATAAANVQFTTLEKPAKNIIIENSHSLESEETMQSRNATITSGAKDDLRRFVGSYTTVNDNFICFGTTDQNTCKQNRDLYMYRIMGVDTSNRLKLIKATKIVKGNTNTFQWHGANNDTKWNASELYSGLNNGYFMKNTKYNYMQQTQWTNLIDPSTYYIGDSIAYTNPTLFQNERQENFTNAKIGLMYLSDYLYANDANTNNWLFIQNGLNGATNTPSGSTAPSAEYEWTMTRYGYYRDGGTYTARGVYTRGTVGNVYMDDSIAVRPVFYLASTTRISNGNGTIGDPYMIAP